MDTTVADLVRGGQHALGMFLVIFPFTVPWFRRLPLRILHAALYLLVAGKACLGNLSFLSLLEWELRDRAASTTSSWFDVPVSDPVMAAARLFGNTALAPLVVLPVGLLVIATFWLFPPSGKGDTDQVTK